jgi:hypothetical protein
LALSVLSLAFSRLSCSVSFLIRSVSLLIRSVSLLICSVSLLICSVSFLICSISIAIFADSCLNSLVLRSISRTGRQFSIDKNDRHGGSDEGDAPLLLDVEGAAGEGDVVIGRKESDQANGQAAEGLGEAKTIQSKPSARSLVRFWRNPWIKGRHGQRATRLATSTETTL